MLRKIAVFLIIFFASHNVEAQSDQLLNKVKQKLDLVNDYVATAVMKTDVRFIKSTLGNVTVYYKKPDKIKIKKANGIFILPKGGIDITLNALLASQTSVIDAGEKNENGKAFRVVKLIPLDDQLPWVISTLWIDPKEALVYKSLTTTKDKGTYEVKMEYGNDAHWALPSKVVFSFDTKDYKLPAGITLEFGGDEEINKPKDGKGMKGMVELNYTSYQVNKGIPSKIFN